MTAPATTPCSPSRGPTPAGSCRRWPTASCPRRFRTATLTVAGAPGVLVCGTGYTGEDGVELLAAPEHAVALWDAIAAAGVEPAGLGARDTLRLEVCFHLYGNDLMETRGPIEAGLGWCCKEDTGFIGADAVRVGPRATARPRSSPRSSSPAPASRARATRSSAAARSRRARSAPCLDVGIGMAYLPADQAEPGTAIEIDVRGKTRPAEVRAKPLYSKET